MFGGSKREAAGKTAYLYDIRVLSQSLAARGVIRNVSLQPTAHCFHPGLSLPARTITYTLKKKSVIHLCL